MFWGAEKSRLRAVAIRWAGLCICAVLLVCASASWAKTGPNTTHLRAVVLKDMPPLFSTDGNGEPTGFAVEAILAVSKIAGTQCDLVVVNSWEEAISAVRNGKADVLPGAEITAQRQAQFLFTDPIYVTPVVCFVRADEQNIQSAGDLGGHSVAVISQETGHLRLRHRQDIVLQVGLTPDEAIFALLSGKADALVCAEPMMLRTIWSIGIADKLKTVGWPLVEIKHALMVRQNSMGLGQLLNQALGEYVNSTEYAESYRRWIGTNHVFNNTALLLWVSVGTLAVGLLAVFIWRFHSIGKLNRELRATVEERLAIQKELELSEERLNRAQQISQLGSFERDMVTGEGVWSDGLFDLHGFERSDSAPDKDLFFSRIHPDDAPHFRREIETPAPGTSEAFLEYRAIPQGAEKYRYMAMHCAFRYDDEGRLIYRYGAIQDITERKQVEFELYAAKERAEIANRSKSLFLANMSHDLRTPLNGAMGMLQLLRREELTPTQLEYVNMALDSSRNLSQLLSDILDLSRVEAGQMLLRPREFRLYELIDSIRNMFSGMAEDKGVYFNVETDPNLPEFVLGDPARLRQVLFNLVGNGLKFTGEGGVTLGTDVLEIADGQCRLLFNIADTGEGIPDRMVQQIFGSFSTAGTPPLENFHGSGLGLNIVKRLAELMGAHVSVEAEPGHGTIMYFAVTLPVVSPVTESAAGQSDQPPDGVSCKHVLVAEDDEPNRIVLCRFLETLGHTTEWVTNGEEALSRLALHDFDFVIMDIQMPKLSGLDATRRIRTMSSFGDKQTIPVVAFTAHAMVGDREAFMEAGMNDYLPKPIVMEDVVALLARLYPSETH